MRYFKIKYIICGGVLWFILHSTILSEGSFLNVHNSIRAGNQIISAVEGYKQKNGHAPSSLNKLVPEFLPSIPLPSAGKSEWHYYSNEDGYYYLQFNTSNYGHYFYSSEYPHAKGGWKSFGSW